MIIQHISNAVQVLQIERRAGNDASIRAVDSPPSYDYDQVNKAANDTNRVLIQLRQNVKFGMSLHNCAKKQVIRVINTETGELIRQMPLEEMSASVR